MSVSFKITIKSNDRRAVRSATKSLKKRTFANKKRRDRKRRICDNVFVRPLAPLNRNSFLARVYERNLALASNRTDSTDPFDIQQFGTFLPKVSPTVVASPAAPAIVSDLCDLSISEYGSFLR
jgi:hypothetical protein